MNVSETPTRFSGPNSAALRDIRDCVFAALDREPGQQYVSTVVYTKNRRMASQVIRVCAFQRLPTYDIIQLNILESATLRDENGRIRKIYAFPLARERLRGTASSHGTCVLAGVVNNPVAPIVANFLARIPDSHLYVVLDEDEELPEWYIEARDGPDAWLAERMQECSLSQNLDQIFVMEM